MTPCYTIHARNPVGHVYGFVYERPSGGFIAVVEVHVVETGFNSVYMPLLPTTHTDVREAADTLASLVIDTDWMLDHPFMHRTVRDTVLIPDDAKTLVEDIVMGATQSEVIFA